LNAVDLELAERDAFVLLADAAAPELRDAIGFRHARLADASCLAAPGLAGNPTFNRVNGLGLTQAVDAAVLDEIDAFFADAGVRYWIGVSPYARRRLPTLLRLRGFEVDYAWAKFGRSTADPPEASTELRVDEIGPGHAAELARVVAAGFGMPAGAAGLLLGAPERLHCFLAFDGDEPVAGAILHAAGRVGWLGAGATLPEHRGRGAQSALLAARVRRAGELGCATVTTETGELVPDRPSASYRNIVRAGFQELYVRPNLLSPERA
jgi:GNAT superfamily N-acetyltransferase